MKYKLLFLIMLLGAGLQARIVVSDSLPITQHHRRMIGLNLTPLISQLMPFKNANNQLAGPYLVRGKSYDKNGKFAFRTSIGVHILTDENGAGIDPQLNIAIGFEKRRSLTKRWSYTSGFDVLILAGDSNLPNKPENIGSVIFGMGPVWGIEYFLAPRVSIGGEAMLLLGYSTFSETIVVDILPPVGIFMNHYF